MTVENPAKNMDPQSRALLMLSRGAHAKCHLTSDGDFAVELAREARIVYRNDQALVEMALPTPDGKVVHISVIVDLPGGTYESAKLNTEGEFCNVVSTCSSELCES